MKCNYITLFDFSASYTSDDHSGWVTIVPCLPTRHARRSNNSLYYNTSNLTYFAIFLEYFPLRGKRRRSGLRLCATCRQVAGSIPDGAIGIFWHNPSGRTVALGLTQPLTEMSTAIPLQAWTGPEGSRRLRLPNFKTIGSPTHRPPLSPGSIPGTHFC